MESRKSWLCPPLSFWRGPEWARGQAYIGGMDRLGLVAGWRWSWPCDRVVPSQTRRGDCDGLPNRLLPLEFVGSWKISWGSLFRLRCGSRISISVVLVHVVAATKNAARLIASSSYFSSCFPGRRRFLHYPPAAEMCRVPHQLLSLKPFRLQASPKADNLRGLRFATCLVDP